jgi:hypothetical protein
LGHDRTRMIESLEITRYTRDKYPYTVESILEPSWDLLEQELRTMEKYEKPILWLCLEAGNGESDSMAINGGNGVYHVQIADSDFNWIQAINPEGSSEMVQVWTSDQGFETEAKFTWDLEKTLEMVRWYFEHGKAHPNFLWQ